MKAPVRVVLASEHPIVLVGLHTLLATEPTVIVIGDTIDHDRVRVLCRELQPDVLLLDVTIPDSAVDETLIYLQRYCLYTKVVVLIACDNYAYMQLLLSLGIAGCLDRGEPSQVIIQAVATVAQGSTWFSHTMTTKLACKAVNDDASPSAPLLLTLREREVLRLIVAAKTNQEIAIELDISEKTVAKHVRGIFGKLQVTSRVEAAVYAVRHKLG